LVVKKLQLSINYSSPYNSGLYIIKEPYTFNAS